MTFLKSLCLKVELLAGIDIADAARDLCELANRIGVLIETDFNTIRLVAKPGDRPAALVEDYNKRLTNKFLVLDPNQPDEQRVEE